MVGEGEGDGREGDGGLEISKHSIFSCPIPLKPLYTLGLMNTILFNVYILTL